MTADWIQQLAGKFIVFDGPDGSGKTTQFRRLTKLAESEGLKVTHVREPGGTNIGEAIRQLLLDPENEEMDLRCELLLYMASRAQLVTEKLGPALERGELVLADRFISSTLAYQGTAGGFPIDEIMAVGKVALGETWPDLVVVFDVDEATAARRLNPLLDRMELKGSEYHRKVREGYLQQVENDPEHYRLVDARADEDRVYEQTCEAIRLAFE